jgi:hypothetical protein
VRFCPAQVHSQQHLCPVLRLGATGAGLDIEKSITGVHFTGKHTPELKLFNLFFEFGQISLDSFNAVFVIFLNCHIQQFTGVIEAADQLFQHQHDLFQPRSFLPQFLRVLRIIPYIRLFQLAIYFFKLFFASVEVKDTP